jgi:hypothetical protein
MSYEHGGYILEEFTWQPGDNYSIYFSKNGLSRQYEVAKVAEGTKQSL